jgi:hypothetical protein
MTSEEIIAAVLFYSNYVLAAIAIYLCVMLFRNYRNFGWLLLGCAFLFPFIFLAMRAALGRPLLTYRRYGTPIDGVPTLVVNWEFPGFYLIVVAALLLLLRAVRRAK